MMREKMLRPVLNDKSTSPDVVQQINNTLVIIAGAPEALMCERKRDISATGR